MNSIIKIVVMVPLAFLSACDKSNVTNNITGSNGVVIGQSNGDIVINNKTKTPFSSNANIAPVKCGINNGTITVIKNGVAQVSRCDGGSHNGDDETITTNGSNGVAIGAVKDTIIINNK